MNVYAKMTSRVETVRVFREKTVFCVFSELQARIVFHNFGFSLEELDFY